ncbi:MAG TPA: globin-coupled sensor protein [Asticcacaulis sp.]|nr:globin-coupled sensor protein [Asticcacaulis sp.]
MSTEVIQKRLAFARITAADTERLANIWDILLPHLPSVVKGFYAHVATEPRLAAMIGTHETRLQAAQIQHWKTLFTDGFSPRYFETAYRIGQTHHRIGLEPRWYIAGYQFVLDHLVDILTRAYRLRPRQLTQALISVNKAVFLDLDIALSTYQQAGEDVLLQRSRATEDAINGFRAEFEQITGLFGAHSDALQATSHDLGQIVEKAGESARAVSHSATRSSQDSTSVAAASEQLTRSIQEINSRITDASQGIRHVVGLAGTSSAEMMHLSEAVTRIGDILGLIQNIASQTNLLALNATIEAARAGEAGRGFAVVASEVKALSGETARATTEIGRHIQEIQTSTSRANASILDMVDAITKVEGSTAQVAVAMDQQSAASLEISGNIQSVSDAAASLSEHISTLDTAVSRIRSASTQVDGSASHLNASSEDLRRHVEVFFENLRAS